MNQISRLLSLVAILVLASMHAAAQPKEWKAEWEKIIKPLYFHSASVNKDKLPVDLTTIKAFRWKDKLCAEPLFEARGTIGLSAEDKKVYTFEFSDGQVAFSDDHHSLTFNGKFALVVQQNKDRKFTEVKVHLLHGRLVYDNDDFSINEAWANNIGYIVVGLFEEYTYGKSIIIDTSSFFPPQKVRRAANPSADVLRGISSGDISLMESADTRFLRSIVGNNDRIVELPGYEELACIVLRLEATVDKKSIILRQLDEVVSDEVVGHYIGDEIVLDDLTAKRSDGRITIRTKAGRNGWVGAEAEYDISQQPSRYRRINWSNGCSYINDILCRDDRSRLSGVAFEQADAESKKGYAIDQLRTLETLCDSRIFDFGEIQDQSGVTITAFFPPESDRPEMVNGVINSVASSIYIDMIAEKRRQAEQMRILKETQRQFLTQQSTLRKEYERYNSDPITVCTTQNKASSTPYDIKLVKRITPNAELQYYNVDYRILDNGFEYILYVDSDGDYYYEIGGNNVFPELDPKVRAELDLWRAAKAYIADPETRDTFLGR